MRTKRQSVAAFAYALAQVSDCANEVDLIKMICDQEHILAIVELVLTFETLETVETFYDDFKGDPRECSNAAVIAEAEYLCDRFTWAE